MSQTETAFWATNYYCYLFEGFPAILFGVKYFFPMEKKVENVLLSSWQGIGFSWSPKWQLFGASSWGCWWFRASKTSLVPLDLKKRNQNFTIKLFWTLLTWWEEVSGLNNYSTQICLVILGWYGMSKWDKKTDQVSISDVSTFLLM